MTLDIKDDSAGTIEQEHHLDGEPGKVWRAVSQSELREAWLPDLRVVAVLSEEPPRAIELLIQEREAPFARSVVRFEVAPAPSGGTALRISHRPSAGLMVANDNACLLSLAA